MAKIIKYVMWLYVISSSIAVIRVLFFEYTPSTLNVTLTYLMAILGAFSISEMRENK